MDSRYVLAATQRSGFVITDATVVDTIDASTTPHQDIEVSGSRIVAIREHGGGTGGLPTVPAEGTFVVPGFTDAHAHPLNHPDEVDGAYALMLANGITAYRQMSGGDAILRRRADGTLPRPPGAPRLLALPGELLTPLNASDEQRAVEAVRHQHQVGADFVKAGFLAALAEANRLGMPLAGHLPDDIDPREASDAGVRCMEHLGTGTALFTATSPHEEHVRGMARPLPRLPRVPGLAALLSKVTTPLVLKAVVNPAARTSTSTVQAYRILDESFDRARAEELAQLLRQNRTWQCPTLIRLHTMQFPQLHAGDERSRYMAPEDLHAWNRATATFARLPQERRDALAAHWPTQLALTKVLADAGVPMLAGTDSSGAGWVIPGFALHDEFDLLAEAGLTPGRILQMATIDAARFSDRDDVAGRVAPGHEADLVLLGADPTRDHRALHDIRGVVRDGDWYGRRQLDDILDRAAQHPTTR